MKRKTSAAGTQGQGEYHKGRNKDQPVCKYRKRWGCGIGTGNDAGGIGLFRSEFLYLESRDYPTEEEQFAAYRKVAEAMAGKKVIIRTLDIGADKQVDYFGLDKEDNPAMGYRAIRICLDRREVFKTQLRALYRASYYGTIAIMFPMIISVTEVQTIKKIIEEVKKNWMRKRFRTRMSSLVL